MADSQKLQTPGINFTGLADLDDPTLILPLTGTYTLRMDDAGVLYIVDEANVQTPIGLAGSPFPAPDSATYITQTPNGTLTNEQPLSALATGLLKNTITTGVLSIAAPGTDYLTPAQINVQAIVFAIALG